jgi:hypothetical protein
MDLLGWSQRGIFVMPSLVIHWQRKDGMHIPLDRQSTEPLYKQIETYLRQGILSGSLAPDMRLPATRQLAQNLGVNRITMKRHMQN